MNIIPQKLISVTEEGVIKISLKIDLLWKDYNRIWDSNKFFNITDIMLQSNKIWTPSFNLYTKYDRDKSALNKKKIMSLELGSKDYVLIHSCGVVWASITTDIQYECMLKDDTTVDYYPSREISCSLIFLIPQYKNDLVHLRVTEKNDTIASNNPKLCEFYEKINGSPHISFTDFHNESQNVREKNFLKCMDSVQWGVPSNEDISFSHEDLIYINGIHSAAIMEMTLQRYVWIPLFSHLIPIIIVNLVCTAGWNFPFFKMINPSHTFVVQALLTTLVPISPGYKVVFLFNLAIISLILNGIGQILLFIFKRAAQNITPYERKDDQLKIGEYLANDTEPEEYNWKFFVYIAAQLILTLSFAILLGVSCLLIVLSIFGSKTISIVFSCVMFLLYLIFEAIWAIRIYLKKNMKDYLIITRETLLLISFKIFAICHCLIMVYLLIVYTIKLFDAIENEPIQCSLNNNYIERASF